MSNYPEPAKRLHDAIQSLTGVKEVELDIRTADWDFPLAMGLLGELYDEGRGVGKDLSKAVDLYRCTAECGEASCQAELGECYEYGKGLK